MTAKIFRNSFFVGLLVLLAAGILFLSVMYGNDETLAFDELRAETAALAPAVERLGLSYLEETNLPGRVTWVAPDGSVLYDNSARKDDMENHLAREEIAAALASGRGPLLALLADRRRAVAIHRQSAGRRLGAPHGVHADVAGAADFESAAAGALDRAADFGFMCGRLVPAGPADHQPHQPDRP